MEVKIQGSDKNIYAVDLGRRTCSCGQKACTHLAIATDIYLHHGKRHRFTLISCAHKSARTSRLDWAWPWAEVFAAISGWNKVSTYYSKAVFEETRNLRLWAQLRSNELTPEERVRLLVLSRKKWESLPGLTDHVTRWTNAYATYQRNKHSWNEARLRRQIKKFSAIEDGYEAWFFIKQKKQFRPAFWEELSARADREKNERLRWYLKYSPSTGYDCMVGIELALNLFDESVNDFHPEQSSFSDFVPAFPDWSEDVHNFTGRRRFLHWFPELLRGELPEKSKLQLQLSGQIWGCSFREAAFNQKGRIISPDSKLLQWAEVRLEQSPAMIAWLDSSFYRCYGDLERKGVWSPPRAPTLPLFEGLHSQE